MRDGVRAVTTLLVRTTSYHTVAATYDLYEVIADEIFGHVTDHGWPTWWSITRSREAGEPIAEGWAFTRDGAWRKAIAAAHRPGIERQARKARTS